MKRENHSFGFLRTCSKDRFLCWVHSPAMSSCTPVIHFPPAPQNYLLSRSSAWQDDAGSGGFKMTFGDKTSTSSVWKGDGPLLNSIRIWCSNVFNTKKSQIWLLYILSSSTVLFSTFPRSCTELWHETQLMRRGLLARAILAFFQQFSNISWCFIY